MSDNPIAEARRTAVEALRMDVDAWVTDPDWTRLLAEQGPEITISRLCEDLAANVLDLAKSGQSSDALDELAGIAAAAMVRLMQRAGGASR